MRIYQQIHNAESKIFTTLLLLFIGFCNTNLGYAQPANDNCVTAQPVIIPAGGTACINSSSVSATSSNTTNTCNAVIVNEVWFSFIAAGPVNNIVVTPNGGSPLQQAVITLSDAACGSATFNVCDAAANAGGTATANWAYAAGTQVFVSVAGILGDGTFEICITSETPPPTPGSSCGGATPSCDPSNFTINSTAGNFSSGISPPCFNITGTPQVVQNDLWFVFTVGQSGTLEFTANINGAAEIDWAVYNITAGCPGTAVVCNYFFSGGNSGSIGLGNPAGGEFSAPLNVTAGNTYAIMIDNYDNNGVGFDFTWGGTFQMAPTADFTITTSTACNTLNTTFTNNTVGGSTYAWDFGNGQTSTQQNPPAQTYNAPGTYFVTLNATSAAGCTNSFSESVEVFPNPTLNFTPTDETCTNACDGQLNVAASGTGPFTYNWAGGGNSATETNLCANTYSVTVTDQSNNCTATGSGTVASGGATFDATINPPNPASPYCEMDAAIQLTTVDPGGTWTGNGVNATGLFTPANANIGTNTITYTIAGACGDVATINLVVLSEMDATITPPLTTTLCETDGAIQLTAATAGGVWSGSGVSPSGLFDPSTSGTGNITITYTSAGGCPNTDQIQFTINAGGIPVISSPSNGPFCITDAAVQLTADLANGTWAGPGVDATGLFNPATAGVGNHAITYSLPPPCGGTDTWNVTVDQVSFQYTVAEPLCNGDATGSINFNSVNGGMLPYTYSTNGGITWNNASPVGGLTAGNYQLSVQDANGCSAIVVNETLTEPGALILQTSSVSALCSQPNGEASVTVSGGTVAIDYTYLWDSASPQSTATATGLVPNDINQPVYTVIVTDDNLCTATATAIVGTLGGFTSAISDITNVSCNGLCDGSSEVSLSPGVSGTPTYDWTDQFGTSVGSAAIVSGLCPGDYTITVTDQDNCTTTDPISITEPDLLTVSINGPPTICMGETQQLEAVPLGGTPGFTYDWSVTPVDPNFVNSASTFQTVTGFVNSNYSVDVTDLNGCIGSATYTLNVLNPLVLTVDPITPVCPGTTADISFSGAGGNTNYTFDWTVSTGHIISPQTTPPLGTNGLTIEITLSDGCTQPNAVQSFTVPVIQAPVFLTVPTQDTAGCAPFEILFSDVTVPAPVSYHWIFNDPYSTSIDTTGPLATHTYTDPGAYQALLEIITTDGCLFAKPINITIDPSPIADFIRTPGDSIPVDFLEPDVLFEELTSNATSFWIHFGTGDSSNLSPVEYAYQDSGLFQASIVAYNDFGCTDTAFNEIHVIPHYTFFMPTAFTPNGDGFNDVINAEGYGLKELRMEIHNRWGELVRVFDTLEDTWDGKHHGSLSQNGIYSYYAVTKDVRGIEHKYSGSFLLSGGD